MSDPSLASIGALHLATGGMRLDAERLRAIANNVANATTPGFRRELVQADAFAAAMAAAADLPAPPVSVAVDPGAGPLRQTGRPLDVALKGVNLLEVQGGAGTAYTRNGALRLDAEGRLVTASGQPVAADGGDIRASGNAPLEILPSGEVRQGERVLGRLKVVSFGAGAQMRALGDGLYEVHGTPRPADADASVLLSGHLEGSNVTAAAEMLSLTETMRHYEALQRIVQGHDEMLEKAIRRLGDL